MVLNHATDVKVFQYTQWAFLLGSQYHIVSADELATAQQYKFEALKHRFLMGRILLRLHLAHKLGVTPASLKFAVNAYAKPYLLEHDYHFNISHTQDYLCIASAKVAVGIDIETKIKATDTVDTVLNTAQKAYAHTLPTHLKLDYLQRKWAQLESIVKCIGTGLSLNLADLHWLHDKGFSALVEYKNQQ